MVVRRNCLDTCQRVISRVEGAREFGLLAGYRSAISEAGLSKMDKPRKYNYVIPTVGPEELRNINQIMVVNIKIRAG